jgi:nitrate/TMAO reductase-like tetraheme cytochrome c subunit
MRWAWLLLVACASSHVATPDRVDCNGCHADQFDEGGTAQVAACTPTAHTTYQRTCADCHGTTSWCPASVNHPQFPLQRSHAGWDCADCHATISYDPPSIAAQPITCTNCHWHTQARVDPFHIGNGDYSYGPSTCLQCHRGGDN